MNPLKITIAGTVIAAICVVIIFWMQHIKEPKKIKPSENQFTAMIDMEIEQLKAKSDNQFCQDFYKQVSYHIIDFHKNNRFGSSQVENDQLKENLEKNLYAAYAEKFIKQAIIVFRHSQWKPDDLQFIQAEKNTLKKSNLLVAGSPVDKEFTNIQTILNKYDEIESFISLSKGFRYSNTELASFFPIAEVKNIISRASYLQLNKLENEFVNNCTRLHDQLKEIPQYLFNAQVDYLDHKINNWSGLYSNYNSQSDYSNNLYKPLKAEIEALNNEIYNVSNFDNEYNRLLQKWNDDNTKAYKHKY